MTTARLLRGAGVEAAVSGERRSARFKCGVRRPRRLAGMIDGKVDHRGDKHGRQRRRSGRQRGADGGGRNADRADIGVTIAGIVMVPALVVRSERRNQDRRAFGTVERVNVAKGKREIDGQRKKRKPRTTPDMLANPAHPSQSFLTEVGTLSERAARFNWKPSRQKTEYRVLEPFFGRSGTFWTNVVAAAGCSDG